MRRLSTMSNPQEVPRITVRRYVLRVSTSELADCVGNKACLVFDRGIPVHIIFKNQSRFQIGRDHVFQYVKGGQPSASFAWFQRAIFRRKVLKCLDQFLRDRRLFRNLNIKAGVLRGRLQPSRPPARPFGEYQDLLELEHKIRTTERCNRVSYRHTK